MTVALFKHSFLRREAGKPKAHAHAAYISGTKLEDAYGNSADFRPKGGVLLAEVWIPSHAPVWTRERGKLWRAVEERENKTTRHQDAILAHKFIGALPHELSLEENARLVRDFVREQFTRKGYVADWAIHHPDPDSDSRNYHVHIMVPLRKFEGKEWSKRKDRFATNSPALSQYIKSKQKAFFDLQNRYLQKNGITAQIIRTNGKWTVTGNIEIDNITSMSQSLAASLAHQPTPVLNQIATLSQSPGLGGGQIAQLQHQSPHQKYETLKQQHHSIISKRGWPEAAVLDWETWGNKDTIRFFRLWPELSGPGYSLGGQP